MKLGKGLSKARLISLRNHLSLVRQEVDEMALSGANNLAIQQLTAEDRRLRILQLLVKAPGYVLNEHVLHRALPRLGHMPAVDVLRNDLMWLGEMLLIQVDMGAPWVARLLLRGDDIANGRARAFGIAYLSPNTE
jgi:hypothetical protein